MRVLSIRQPWAWIILNLGKRVENRSRSLGQYRGPVLLHATRGAQRDWDDAYRFCQERFGRPLADKIPVKSLPVGVVVAIAKVVNQCSPGPKWLDTPPTNWKEQESWYMGNHAYILDQVTPTKEVLWKGSLGLWRPPQDLIDQLELKWDPTAQDYWL